MSRRGRRFARRLAARRRDANTASHLGDPREPADRRQAQRRQLVLSPEEVADWLRRNGIPGPDRRTGDRRRQERRR